MQTQQINRRCAVTHRLEWMGLMIAVLSLVGLTAGGIHTGTRHVENVQLVSAQP